MLFIPTSSKAYLTHYFLLRGYEKANEHVPFWVQVMYLKIVEQPTFTKPVYLTSFP
jgi:hypothetical protein